MSGYNAAGAEGGTIRRSLSESEGTRDRLIAFAGRQKSLRQDEQARISITTARQERELARAVARSGRPVGSGVCLCVSFLVVEANMKFETTFNRPTRANNVNGLPNRRGANL